MGVPFLDPRPMNADEFFAFTATRPDDEKWELIEGEPVLNASASFLHQIITRNLIVALDKAASDDGGHWVAVPGLGLRLSEINAPIPDVLIRPNDALKGAECSDAMVVFEILSPATANHDLRWKRKAYATLPSLSQYVVVAQDAVEIVSYDRTNRFAERRLESADAELDLPIVGARLSLRNIYRDTGLLSA
jgi:Uma2 family endonuclease